MIYIKFMMTIASSTGIKESQLPEISQASVADTLQALGKKHDKNLTKMLIDPEKNRFKPGILVLSGPKGEKLSPARLETVLQDGDLLKITTVVGGG